MKNALIFFSCFLFFIFQTNAQIWTSKKNKYEAGVSFSIATFKNAYDSIGNSISLFPFQVQNQNIQFYGQYGITDLFTIQLKLPYTIQTTKYEGRESDLSDFDSLKIGSLNGFGNIECTAIYQIKKTNPYLNALIGIETPSSKFDFYTGLATGYRAWSFKPGIALAGTNNKFWYSAFASADLKSNQYNSSLNSNVEIGYKPMKEIYFSIMLLDRISFQNGDFIDCNLLPTGIYFNDQEYLATHLKTGFVFNEASIHFGVATALMAQNVPASPIYSIGFSYKRK